MQVINKPQWEGLMELLLQICLMRLKPSGKRQGEGMKGRETYQTKLYTGYKQRNIYQNYINPTY